MLRLVLRVLAVLSLAAIVGALGTAVVTRMSESTREAAREADRFNATAAADPEPVDDEPIVTVIGDNMSAVSQAARPVREWPLIVAPELGARIISMSTASSGYTSKPISWTYGGTFLSRAPHIAGDSSLVVLFGGANDGGARSTRVYDSAVNTILAVREAAPDARILMVGPVHTSTELPENLDRVRDTLQRVARDQRVRFVDPIADRWVDGEGAVFRNDGVTPTTKGQEVIAERILPELKDLLP